VTHSRFIRFAPVLLLCLGSLLLLSYVGFAKTGRIYSKLRCDRVATLVEIAAAPEWGVLGDEKIAGLLRLADSAIFSVDVLDAVPPERVDGMAAGACQAAAPLARGAGIGRFFTKADGRVFDAALRDRFVPVLLVVIGTAFAVFLVQVGSRPNHVGRRRGGLVVAAGLSVVGAMLVATAFGTLGGVVLDRTVGGVEFAKLLAAETALATPPVSDVQGLAADTPALAVSRRVLGEDVVPIHDGTGVGSETVPWIAAAGAILPKMRNFAVLLLAGGLLGWILMSAGMAIVRAGTPGDGTQGDDAAGDGGEGKLLLVKPAYFLAIFIDSLSLSFLSSFTTGAAVAEGYQASAGSIPFTVFFLCLTIAQVPTGRYAERGNLKLLMMAGVGVTVAGLLILALAPGFVWICVGRGLAGIGQGSLYIAMQNYALAVSPPERRTQAAAIQFAGASGGMISGTAIGGLLAVSVPVEHIFLLSAAVGVATMAYMVLVVANVHRDHDIVTQSFLQDLRGTLGDAEFVRTLVLISIQSKFVLVGVVLFAMPLVLHRVGYGKDLIAQIMMVYAVTTLLVTLTGAKLVDRLNSARLALFLGTLASGLGLALFGAATWAGGAAGGAAGSGATSAAGIVQTALEWLQASTGIGTGGPIDDMLILMAMILVGVSQGLIAAPSITHIVDTPIAERRGWAAVVSMHRLLERAGHVSGPLVMGWGLAATSGGGLTVGAVGLVTIAGGTLFIATVRHHKIKEAPDGAASADMSIVNSTHD
jgi:MFS family permease